MTPDVLLAVSLFALACAVVVGAGGLLSLRLLARSSLVLQLMVVALATVVSVVGGMAVVASQMYVSRHDLTVFYSVAGVAGLVSLMMAAVLGRQLARDSRTLRSAAASIGRGERIASTDRQSNTEFTALAGELAATGERLAESRARENRVEESRRELIAWISHDLRTPLAGIRAMAEALEDGMAEDPERYYTQMRGQVDRLTGMVDDLFELSKIHSGTLRLRLEPVSLYDLISDTVAGLWPIAQAKSLDLRFAGEMGLTILADPRELSRVVGNLVMNAIQHSPPGSPIVVSVTESTADRALISVTDAAGGIPEQDLGRVFEAGWRASGPRTPAAEPLGSGGAGLGLAIVQGIVQAHRGEVRVHNVANGCRFEVLLPQHPVAAAGRAAH
ncbi:HAMP domain-containing histidine kinase [Cryobacterium sp. TMT1-21]|uniref:Sensor-like histidine kinase SenX3 n=1 Tax=Cryobacterium shii TaxID=1259235 RepID=A0AAQ2C6Q0_9MICO|nr:MULTISPECIES: HAMP domain-containing sensor histidine kinase [Cryobacterium]TFC48271.1 HAMP domain-containing histidine kinase [Cryobacterium shii]TFC83794.1 HAMP domain-containing histidine kinase [Cryobacterium sp. TmT2-59]TFD15459.1 HAMP domain-containing histidine kinase [Cryobacterium sp. TMT1-21]TFD16648.1 HAMP domain-containing histidine kinase [Cryobacterium sp. TMT4-10]TFD21893.1 HAMP domain-containing histidine kinase [Cryobacterium sp. TMT2-23]